MLAVVHRTSQSYVRPGAASPSGVLELSAIDRAAVLRHQVRSVHVFARRGRRKGEPARAIRSALAKALVDYYPLAGRLVGGGRVECTGEGAWFVEAAAGCSLDDVGRLEQYPLAIPEDDLLPDAAPGAHPLEVPVMMQVTEFSCGGFAVGIVYAHAVADGQGAAQFVNAIADYARGLPKPRVTPVWARELIPSPPPPRAAPPPPCRQITLRQLTFDLSSDYIDNIRSLYAESAGGRRCSAFDVAAAVAWRTRTRALRPRDPSARVSLGVAASTRHLVRAPAGGYGSCYYPVVRVVRGAKARLAGEFARWAAGDRLAGEEDPYDRGFDYESFYVTDWTRLGFVDADYGLGTPTHVVPLTYYPGMPAAIICRPPPPLDGVRIMTLCVGEKHLQAFKEETNEFRSARL